MEEPVRTRRDFLRAVGISGGAGAMLATMGALGLAPTRAADPRPYVPPGPSDFALTGRSAASVVVLGGGVAGLTVAYELGKAGYDCTVLEARGVPGGRVNTVRGGTVEQDLDGRTQWARFSDGVYFNSGAARIAQWMLTMDYCRELGVPLETFVNANADAYVFLQGMGEPQRARTLRADSLGYVSELLAKATDRGALDAELTPDDKERLLAFLPALGDIGDRAGDRAYAGGPRRGFDPWPGAGPGTPLPGPPPLAQVLGEAAGRQFAIDAEWEQAMPMFQPVGGMDRIPRALARAVGVDRVLLGAAVTGVRDTGGGVEVTYRRDGRDERVRADHCVVTLPPYLTARIPHNLGAEVAAALGAFRPLASGKLGLEYRSRWWESDHRIYGGITHTDADVASIFYPSHGFHGGRGLLVGYYNFDADAARYDALTPEQRVARAVEVGVRIHGPKYRDELAGSFSRSWARTPYLEGCLAVSGGAAGAADVLRRPAGRVWFAGDWLSQALGWQHGAFASARATVTALHARVLAD
jgi:monoamine oxidase